MKANKEILEDQLESYDKELKSLSSYLQELKTTTAHHGTEAFQYEDDRMEAEHNVQFYEAEIAEAKKKLAESEPGPIKPGPGSILPQTAKQGIGPMIFSSIGFAAGALFGHRLQARKRGKDSN